MKLLKKLLAAVTVTALALTMLTACGGDGKTTFTVVDYLNDSAKMYGDNTTYKADTALDNDAKNVAAFVKSTGAKSVDELEEKLNNDEALMASFVKAAGVTAETKDKYFYQVGCMVTDPKLTTDAAKDNFGLLQAEMLKESMNKVNVPESIKVYDSWGGEEHWYGAIDETKLDTTTSVGTAELEVGGQKYLVAIFRTAVKSK